MPLVNHIRSGPHPHDLLGYITCESHLASAITENRPMSIT